MRTTALVVPDPIPPGTSGCATMWTVCRAVIPFVVSVEFAHRRFAVVLCSTMTVPRSGPSSSRARSTNSWGLMPAPPAGC